MVGVRILLSGDVPEVIDEGYVSNIPTSNRYNLLKKVRGEKGTIRAHVLECITNPEQNCSSVEDRLELLSILTDLELLVGDCNWRSKNKQKISQQLYEKRTTKLDI